MPVISKNQTAPKAEGEKKARSPRNKAPKPIHNGIFPNFCPNNAARDHSETAIKAKFQEWKGGQNPETKKTASSPYSFAWIETIGGSMGFSGRHSKRPKTKAKNQTNSGI